MPATSTALNIVLVDVRREWKRLEACCRSKALHSHMLLQEEEDGSQYETCHWRGGAGMVTLVHVHIYSEKIEGGKPTIVLLCLNFLPPVDYSLSPSHPQSLNCQV